MAVATLALGAIAQAAPAQTQETMQFVGGSGVGAFGVQVGPYRGRILTEPGMPVIDIFCVDFTHGISNGQVWTANFSNGAGNLSATRQEYYFGAAVARIKYQQAAWLATQFSVQPQSNWGVIHAAIWHLFTPTNPGVSPHTLTTAQWNQSNWWLQQAQNVDNYGTINTQYLTIITDTRTADSPTAGVQEYITYVTPEPAVVVLLGTGLFATFGLAALRKRAV